MIHAFALAHIHLAFAHVHGFGLARLHAVHLAFRRWRLQTLILCHCGNRSSRERRQQENRSTNLYLHR
jgi:hypothetical protein